MPGGSWGGDWRRKIRQGGDPLGRLSITEELEARNLHFGSWTGLSGQLRRSIVDGCRDRRVGPEMQMSFLRGMVMLSYLDGNR